MSKRVKSNKKQNKTTKQEQNKREETSYVHGILEIRKLHFEQSLHISLDNLVYFLTIFCRVSFKFIRWSRKCRLSLNEFGMFALNQLSRHDLPRTMTIELTLWRFLHRCLFAFFSLAVLCFPPIRQFWKYYVFKWKKDESACNSHIKWTSWWWLWDILV